MFAMICWFVAFIFINTVTSAVNWCIIPPTLHVLYNQTCNDFSKYETNSIQWDLLKGEYGNIQLLIESSSSRNTATPTDILSDFSFKTQNFINTKDSNDILPASLLTLYQQAHVDCKESKEYQESGGGWRPDPLFELNAEYGASLPLSSTNGQIIWINIGQIGYNVNPGNYTSQLTVLFDNNNVSPSITINISLTVWNISIPSTINSKFTNIWSYDDSYVHSFYNSSYNQTQLQSQYFDFLESYRMPPDSIYNANTRSFDVYEYMWQHSKWFNLEDVQTNANIAGNNYAQCDGYTQKQMDAVIDSLNYTVSELEKAGKLNQAYVYGFDEVPASCGDGVKQIFGGVQKQWPQIKTLSSLDWGYPPVTMPLNAWNVLYYMYNSSEGEQWVNSAKDRTQFLYHSVSPGNAAYLNTFIERPLMEARILFWLGASYINVGGWLYYDVAMWQGCPADGSPYKGIIHRYNKSLPLTDFPPANYFHCSSGNYAFGNGDGFFLYPGEYGPVTSSRLENIRDGFEDLELFRMLYYMGKQQEMENLIHQIVSAPNKFTLDPLLLEQVRKQAIQLVLANV